LQSSEIALYKAKQDIMNTVIIAPSDGTVVSVNLKKDYVLSAQDYSSRSAITLVDTTDVRFTGMVDEIDIMKVQKGQKANITVDAIPDKVFTGAVKFISPFGTQSGQVIKFAVTIELDPTDVELRGSLTATADINTYSAKNVLLIPTTAIITTPMGSMVTVINEATGQTEPRRITLGKQSFQYAEVLEGLKEGEKILLQPMGQGQFPAAPTQRGTMRMLR
jgi:HlyD family secretion protein